jgi:hypothetical protein
VAVVVKGGGVAKSGDTPLTSGAPSR